LARQSTAPAARPAKRPSPRPPICAITIGGVKNFDPADVIAAIKECQAFNGPLEGARRKAGYVAAK
jgi:hypothetical protein